MGTYGYTGKNDFIKEWLSRSFRESKLRSPLGLFLIIFFSLMIGLASAMFNYLAGLAVVGVLSVVLLIICFLRYPYFGLYFTLGFTAVNVLITRLLEYRNLEIPFNLVNVSDVLIIILLISVLDKPNLRLNIDVKIWKNPIVIAFSVFFSYYIIQAVNPNKNISGWFSFFEKFLISMIGFYILLCLFRSWRNIRYFIYFNIVLTTLMAAYACKQQLIGIADFENQWLLRNPRTYSLFFQWGLLRKWSILSDPSTSGLLFASVSLQALVLFLREKKRRLKFLLFIAFGLNALGFIYSGTRTATMMVVVGIVFYGICTFYERTTKIMLVMAIGAFVVIMTSPYSPPSINRMRSTFQGTKDPSAAIRDFDRHQVLPYLYKHPLGGGIYTTGMEGPKYNPGHELVDFQPDSGYMKTFAEQGWIGLLIMVILFYIILNYALKMFYHSSNIDMQNHSIAITILIFSLMVGQYSQFALTSFPLPIMGVFAFLVRMPELDKKQTLKPIQ